MLNRKCLRVPLQILAAAMFAIRLPQNLKSKNKKPLRKIFLLTFCELKWLVKVYIDRVRLNNLKIKISS